MSKTKHPLDKRERYIIAQKKKKLAEAERAGRIRKRLERERIKEQETQSELLSAASNTDVYL